MKKRTKIFLVCCAIFAIVFVATAVYYEYVTLGIAGGLISGYILGVIDKYCD